MLGLMVALTSLEALAQATLTGKVLDAETAEALVGATVLATGGANGTITDSEGRFVLSHEGQYPLVLTVRFLGYETAELELVSGRELEVHLHPSSESLEEVTVTARRRNEQVQEIPIPMAVIGARELDNSTSFNVNTVKELVPSVQLYSSNPRNTTLNIRGIGSTFGLTNDGIDPGVGFYVDGVYYARPAAATLEFIDVQQIEVLRGPQGTLFGKNTIAGTFNITSRKPTFAPSGIFEQSFGNFGFIQTKGSVSGPLAKDKLAVRLSFTGTHRDGTLFNVATQSRTNTLSNQGARGQLLFLPTARTSITLAADYTRQRPDGYAQVYAGTAPTQRADFQQFERIIADLGYDLPSRDPFDKLIDHDTPWRSNQDMGGVSANADFEFAEGTLTSTTAWRGWSWDPSNDRDFTGLSAIAKSQAPSIHHQLSQELRYSGQFGGKLSGTVGLFAFYQKLDPDGAHTLEAGPHQWRFAQNNLNPLWQTPGLLDGLRQDTRPRFRNFSGALFAQADWAIAEKLVATLGLRLNYDQKEVDYQSTVSGGLATDDPALLALQRQVFAPLAFQADVEDWNLSGQLGLRYVFSPTMMAYSSYSNGFKPVGLNLGGIPTSDGEPELELAVIEPERVNHFEAGLKTQPLSGSVLNLTLFQTDIFDYQTTVRSAEIGVIRGYLANAEQVRTRGAELEASHSSDHLRFTLSVSYTEGHYVKFTNAPVPLEETGSGGNELKDISGEVLPGISKWSMATGLEGFVEGRLFGQEGAFFAGADVFHRSGFSSNPTPSQYLNIDGYVLVNARLGFRTPRGVSLYVWSRNLGDKDYFEQLLPGGGNAGHYAGVLGDPRTYGMTLRYSFY